MPKIRLKFRIIQTAALLGAAVLVAGSVSAAIVIDDFTGVGTSSPWPMVVTAASPLGYGWENGVAGVLGGNRASHLNINASPFPVPGGSAVAGIDLNAGFLSVTANGEPPLLLQLVYGGENGLDLDMSGEIGFEIVFHSMAFPTGQIPQAQVWVWDGTPNERGTATLSMNVDHRSPHALRFELAQFAGDPVNWRTIQLVVISIQAPAGAQFEIEQFGTYVPAPTALFLILLSGVRASRRRQIGA